MNILFSETFQNSVTKHIVVRNCKIFRYDADCVMKNIFEIFDTLNTGKVNQNEILWVFSMAMNGTGKFQKIV